MNGIHDLGGRDGLGAVAPPPPGVEPVWKAEWEKHAHAMFPLAFRAGHFGLDEFRFAMEQMEPVEYLTSAYYEHWLHAAEHYGGRAGGPRRARPRRDDLPRRGRERPGRGPRARLHRALHQRGALGRRGGRAERLGHLRRLGALHRPRCCPGECRMTVPHTVATAATPEPQAEVAARVKAVEALMIEKGLMSTEAVDRVAEIYENEVGPQLGAKVVAKAWTDPDFKARLLANATEACAELGIGGLQGGEMVAVEDTEDVHHVIVCTLCSCYPWPVLGLPPNWYKQPAYRARIVREPRKVLREEFGYAVPDTTEVRVWDSSSELRYWVLPQRPGGTEDWSAEQLEALVTRDSMVGVGAPKAA